jgi:hypothetical protein
MDPTPSADRLPRGVPPLPRREPGATVDRPTDPDAAVEGGPDGAALHRLLTVLREL